MAWMSPAPAPVASDRRVYSPGKVPSVEAGGEALMVRGLVATVQPFLPTRFQRSTGREGLLAGGASAVQRWAKC